VIIKWVVLHFPTHIQEKQAQTEGFKFVFRLIYAIIVIRGRFAKLYKYKGGENK